MSQNCGGGEIVSDISHHTLARQDNISQSTPYIEIESTLGARRAVKEVAV